MDLQYVAEIIANEGFDYTFEGYSHFKEIKDKVFHEKRKAFLLARDALEVYINENTEEVEEY